MTAKRRKIEPAPTSRLFRRGTALSSWFRTPAPQPPQPWHPAAFPSALAAVGTGRHSSHVLIVAHRYGEWHFRKPERASPRVSQYEVLYRQLVQF